MRLRVRQLFVWKTFTPELLKIQTFLTEKTATRQLTKSPYSLAFQDMARTQKHKHFTVVAVFTNLFIKKVKPDPTKKKIHFFGRFFFFEIERTIILEFNLMDRNAS
jgi:hypothetical protein